MILRSVIALVLCLALLPSAPAAQTDGELAWLQEIPFDEVLARAQAEGKPVLIDFYAVWCGPCKWLDKEVYTHAAVLEESRNYIPFKVDCEKGDGVELARRFRIFNYPTLVFLDAQGQEVDRFLGTRPAEAFAAKMRDVRKGVGTLADLQRRLEQKPDDRELRKQVAEVLVFQAKPEAETHLTKLIEDDAGGDYASWAMLMRGDLARRLEDFPRAVEATEAALARFPDRDEVQEQGLGNLAYYHGKLGHKEQQVEIERRILERDPDSPQALNRFAWNVAKTGLALEEAATAATKAVELSQRDPGYVDTLAEVCYRRGMYDQAIELMRECIQKQPDDSYFQDQMAKFEKARKGA